MPNLCLFLSFLALFDIFTRHKLFFLYLLLVEKVVFQATEMALCAAFLKYNNKKGFALLNFGQICSVNHQNPVVSRSKTVDIVLEISC